MKPLITFLFILLSLFVFSQKKDAQETKISSEKLKKATVVKDIVPEFKTNYDVLSAEYSFSKKGKICVETTNGNEIPKSITTYAFPKGAVIFIDLKVKVLDNSNDPKILSLSQKIRIE